MTHPKPLTLPDRQAAIIATHDHLHTAANHMHRARQLLLDSELQAAVIAAQQYGGTSGGQGATAWSDPTGQTATTDAATVLRANQITRGWMEAIATIGHHVRAVFGHDLPATLVGTLGALDPLRRDLGSFTEADDRSLTAAYSLARDLNQGWVAGPHGKRVPGVGAVIKQADDILSVQPPPPKQKPIKPCRVCGPFHAPTAKQLPSAVPGAGGRCQVCDTFHRNWGCDRTLAIWRRAEYGKGPTPAQMIEARAAGKGTKREKVTG